MKVNKGKDIERNVDRQRNQIVETVQRVFSEKIFAYSCKIFDIAIFLLDTYAIFTTVDSNVCLRLPQNLLMIQRR